MIFVDSSVWIDYFNGTATPGAVDVSCGTALQPKIVSDKAQGLAAVTLRPSPATPDGAILGRNPKGRRPFSRNTALQLARVAQLHRVRCALSWEKNGRRRGVV